MENRPPGKNKTFLDSLTTLGSELKSDEVTPPAGGVPAAVLAPLILPSWESSREQAKLLYIKRSPHLKKHAGQIAFPGGVAEPDDGDLLATGYREGAEEVGLKRSDTRFLGTLPPASTPTGFALQPYFVATIQRSFVAQESEVESIHLIDVEELLSCPVRVEQREWRGKMYRVVYFDTESVCVWGVTGRITEFLLTHFFQWEPPK